MDSAGQQVCRPLHSVTLSKEFAEENGLSTVYFYHLAGLTHFGVFASMLFEPPNPSLFTLVDKFELYPQCVQELVEFQTHLWGKLIRHSGTELRTDAKLLVVPLCAGKLHLDLVAQASEAHPMYCDTTEPYEKLFHSVLKPIVWQPLHEVTQDTLSSDFLLWLLGPKHSKLQNELQRYEGLTAFDVIFDERVNLSSVSSFRSFLMDKEFDLQSKLVMGKQVRSVNSKIVRSSDEAYSQGTPLLLPETLQQFFLPSEYFAELRQLLYALRDLEEYSYTTELVTNLNYKGNYLYIEQARTAPCLSSSTNYESLETIGDSVLKLVSTLHLFVDNPKHSEAQLTRKRNSIVSNAFLAGVCDELDFAQFLKLTQISIHKYVPPYTQGGTCPLLAGKVSRKMKADFLEAVIGAMYVGEGCYSAARLLEELHICGATMEYFMNDSIAVSCRLSQHSGTKISELFGEQEQKGYTSRSELGALLQYEFADKNLLDQALTVYSSNPDCSLAFQRLEFLGDAVLDLIVVSNLWELNSDLTPGELSLMKNAIVKNSTLAKFSVLLTLHQHLTTDSETKQFLQQAVSEFDWDEELAELGTSKDNPPKLLGDVFEAVVGAILVDSQSLFITACIVGSWLNQVFNHLVMNRDHISQHVKGQLYNWCSRQGGSLQINVEAVKDGFRCEVWHDAQLLGCCTHSSKVLAERWAICTAFENLPANN